MAAAAGSHGCGDDGGTIRIGSAEPSVDEVRGGSQRLGKVQAVFVGEGLGYAWISEREFCCAVPLAGGERSA